MSDAIYCQRCGGATEWIEHDARMRPRCVRCGAVVFFDPKLAVAVLVSDRNRLLLGKRGPGAREPGKWSFPAGFVERGEVVERAAAREVEEEVGLSVEVGTLLGVYSYEGEEVALVVYAASRFEGQPVAGDDLVEVDWFAADDLPELAFPHDRQIIDDWFARRSTREDAG
jgi:8-oxo-dGTP diphosphatase